MGNVCHHIVQLSQSHETLNTWLQRGNVSNWFKILKKMLAKL